MGLSIEKTNKMPAHLDHEETALTYISSEHATSRSADGHQFTVNMNNSVFVEKSSGIGLAKAIIPNVFPNINAYRNQLEIGGFVITIPVGQYTATEMATYITAQNVINGVGVVLTYDGTRFTFTNNDVGPGNRPVEAIPEVWDWLGWNWRELNGVAGDFPYQLLIAPAGGVEVAPHPAAMFGEKLVHISCDKLAHGNLVDGADGKLYDILVTIPLGETVWHALSVWQPPEDSTYRINFKYVNSITSSLVFQVFDSRMRPLPFAPNHHMQLVLKVYHKEHSG
jgi:hypothetical protein